MPRRDDIRKILVLGSGPIVIGQAAEFDYSGAQACKVLLEEGYEVVLVNSNPATIMTDPEFATSTYIEPLLPGSVAKVIERERPDALLPTLGGGTALDLARELSEDGTLDEHRVELIGATTTRSAAPRTASCSADHGARRPARAAQRRRPLDARGRACAARRWACRRSSGRASRWAARAAASRTPRPSTGRSWPRGSPPARSGRCSVEESVIGWGEFELEVMRDQARQRRDRLLDRERRPDGRPHGRHASRSRRSRRSPTRSTRSCATRPSR